MRGRFLTNSMAIVGSVVRSKRVVGGGRLLLLLLLLLLFMLLLLFSFLYVYMHVCRVADGGSNVVAFLSLADSNP